MDGTFIPSIVAICLGFLILQIVKTLINQTLIKLGGKVLSGKAKTTLVAFSLNDSSIDWITAATQLEQETFRVLKPSDSPPRFLSRRQHDILLRIRQKLLGEGLPVLVLVSLPVEECPTLKPSSDASDEYPKVVQVHGVSRLTTR